MIQRHRVLVIRCSPASPRRGSAPRQPGQTAARRGKHLVATCRRNQPMKTEDTGVCWAGSVGRSTAAAQGRHRSRRSPRSRSAPPPSSSAMGREQVVVGGNTQDRAARGHPRRGLGGQSRHRAVRPARYRGSSCSSSRSTRRRAAIAAAAVTAATTCARRRGSRHCCGCAARPATTRSASGSSPMA